MAQGGHQRCWIGCPSVAEADLAFMFSLQPTGREEGYKVRDVKYSERLGRLATLTTNGLVQLWDPHLSPIRTVRRVS